MISDEQIINLLKSNPSDGISISIDLYGGAIEKICRTYLKGYSKEDTEEAISDCYVELWKSVGKFDIKKNVSLKSYFYGIARRVCLNKRRAMEKYNSKIQSNTDMEMLENVPDDTNVEEITDKKLQREIISVLIQELVPPDDKIFALRYYNQLSIKEIASKLQITAKTVENHLARGKLKLEKQLIESGVMI